MPLFVAGTDPLVVTCWAVTLVLFTCLGAIMVIILNEVPRTNNQVFWVSGAEFETCRFHWQLNRCQRLDDGTFIFSHGCVVVVGSRVGFR